MPEEQKFNYIKENREKNFWLAQNLLQNPEFDQIKKGIEIAKSFQEAIVNEAIFLIDRKGIYLTNSNFRWAALKKETI